MKAGDVFFREGPEEMKLEVLPGGLWGQPNGHVFLPTVASHILSFHRMVVMVVVMYQLMSRAAKGCQGRPPL